MKNIYYSIILFILAIICQILAIPLIKINLTLTTLIILIIVPALTILSFSFFILQLLKENKKDD